MQTKFRHLKDNSGKMIATIATQLVGDNVRVAAAVCHSNDTPTRERGRFICARRLEAGKYITMDYTQFKQELVAGTVLNRFTNDYVRTKRGW